jgi:RimJ/RimL family protein N-acetyltransferase
MSLAIRVLTSEDAALFRDIRLEGLMQQPEAFSSTYEVESVRPLGFFAERLAGSTVFGGFEGATLLGVAGFKRHEGLKERHKAMLWGMYVRPEARGRGLGARLVEAVLAHARGRVEIVMLACTEENRAARRLYESAGFVAYGIERHALKQGGRYYDDVLMAARLA